MEETQDINKRILKNRKETEKLGDELQALINAGLGKTKVQQQELGNIEVKDPSVQKVQIDEVYNAPSQMPGKKKISQDHSKETSKKGKTYNVEEAREYIKKQKQKRLEERKLSAEDKKVSLEIKQKKLQELHKKATELVQKNLGAKKRPKSRDRADYVRPDTDHFLRSKSASRVSSVKNIEAGQSSKEMQQSSVKEQHAIKTKDNKKINILQNIELFDFNVYETSTKETQTPIDPCTPFPRWLLESSAAATPHNVINAFRSKLTFGARPGTRCPDFKIERPSTPPDLLPLEMPESPTKFNLDPKTVEHLELKPSVAPSVSNLSGSESDTSKNIPEISSESGAIPKKKTESVKKNVFSDVNFSINTYNIDSMQLKKGGAINIQSDLPAIIITDEDDYSFDHQRLEERKKSIISLGSPDGQGFRHSVNKSSSSIKTDPQLTPAHSKKIPGSSGPHSSQTPIHSKNIPCIKPGAKAQFSDSSNRSPSQESPPRLSKGSFKEHAGGSKSSKTTPKHNNELSEKPSPQISKTSSKGHKSSELRKVDPAQNLQRPDRFVNAKRGSGSSVFDDVVFKFEQPKTLVRESDVSIDISQANQTKSELSIETTSAEPNLNKNGAAKLMPLKEPTTQNLLTRDDFVNTKSGSGSYIASDDLVSRIGQPEALLTDSYVSTEISQVHQTKCESTNIKTTSAETNLDIGGAAKIMPLEKPTASLNINDESRNNHDCNKSRVLKNICIRTNKQNENPNEIHLKFEAEIHLLNDFNESLRQLAEVEKAFETLKNDSVSKKYLAATKDTYTSAKSLDSSEQYNKENSVISSVNYSRGSLSEAPVNSALESSDSSLVLTGLELSNMEISQKSSTIRSSVELVNLKNNVDDHFTKMSLNLFEQLIKDEDTRLENLKTILKIREKALLDRTKGELAWLEIQRKHLKETGKLQEASTIKKKQRGIILNLQKEKNEMQRLKQMQKAASAKRKTALKEQSSQLRQQLVTTNMMSKMKINTSRERRLSGPIKVLQSKTESIRSETSMSRKSSTDRDKEVYSIASHQSIVSRVSEFSEIEVSSRAIESEVENRLASLRKNLLMKEAALNERRKAAEELLQCHQKLLEEEKRVIELESMAKSIICQKSDATKKRKTWSVPVPLNIPKTSDKDKTPLDYASDFEVESIVDVVDQNIKDLMSSFSKVQDNISMLGISKSSKSDEDENKVEENSVIEAKRSKKSSAGTISSINSVSGPVATEISERLSKSVSPRASEAYTTGEERSIVPQIASSSIESEEKSTSELEVSEKLLPSMETTVVSENVYEPLNNEKGISAEMSPDVSEKPGVMKSDLAYGLKTSIELSEEVLKSLQRQNTTSEIRSVQGGQNDISKISKSSAPSLTMSKKSADQVCVISEAIEKLSGSLSGIEELSDTFVNEEAPEALERESVSSSEINEASRIKATSQSSDKALARKSVQDRSQLVVSDNVDVLEKVVESLSELKDLSDSSKTKGTNIEDQPQSVVSDEVVDIISIQKSLSKKGSKEVSVVPEIIKKSSDILSDIEVSVASSETKATSYTSEECLHNSRTNKENDSVQSYEITPAGSAEVFSDEISERSSKVAEDVSPRSKQLGLVSETIATACSTEPDEIISVIDGKEEDEVGKFLETSKCEIFHKSEENDARKTTSDEVSKTATAEKVPEEHGSSILSPEAPPISIEGLSESDDGEVVPKSRISEIVAEALRQVYGVDEGLYKDSALNSDVSSNKISGRLPEAVTEYSEEAKKVGESQLLLLNEYYAVSNEDTSEAVAGEEFKPEEGIPCELKSIVEQSENCEKLISEKAVDSEEIEEHIATKVDDETNEKMNAAEVGVFTAELVLESAASLSSTLDRSISERFAKTAEEAKSTEKESNVPCTSYEANQKSVVEHLETDIDEELSLDASEEQNIATPIPVLEISDGSFSKSSSNREILDLSYGAVETSPTKEEINSYEEKEQDSLSQEIEEDSVSVSQKPVKSVDVKKRVSEIMADANLTRGDKSPRLQDIYITTYDLISPANSPEYGSPINVNKPTPAVSIFGEEAEEIFKKQLAIEQEIKAITEQQQKEQQLPFLFVREIPNKPPPPYTPPSSSPSAPPVQSIVPTKEEIDEITKYTSKILYKAHLAGKLDKVTISDSTLNLIGTTISKERYRFVFDLCKEICRWHYGQFEESTCPSWLKVTGKPKLVVEKPLDAAGLEMHMTKKLRELYGYEKPIIRENAIIKWCKKKRNHIDEILITESLQEESQWRNSELDNKLVMDKITNEIMNMLLIKETEEVFRNVFCKKIVQRSE
ncbi:unnamed protein product [Acanthoscelides obtectus]|uniref:Centrosome-associated protein 350 n=2 Tax=Acanthoscelides obtectus TaxID=200917 RepID=A0A9P0L255_ACAOB|nr:unnamed protein product [Acanthoscelides obtectus]CAK1638349.1 Centrosome-associated protein 350 [Acanthoscelides obtectus]